ncbi:hypothetical protein HGM15179_002360 [Zosterops borbonicus]|uniref:Rna-directed dna polymerase from mobile element jockey-like n=1 Tax=Zosterops borbonicus TaxID=364589 RepID=A0A8K1GUM3_9PASS|nr:hypothetical protein HGM15179_002360 [Zosterops borbonicus]
MGNKQETTVQQQNYDTVAITEAWWHDLHNCNVPMDGYELFGVECTVSKFADDTNWELLRDKKPLQRDPDRLEHWTMIKAMKFNMSKCWILDPGQSNTGLKYRLGEEWLESSPARGSGDAGPQQALCE